MFGIMLKLIRITLSALQNVDWYRLFANKTVHQQVNLYYMFSQILFQIKLLRVMTIPWINDNIKNKMYKNYKRNSKKTRTTSY